MPSTPLGGGALAIVIGLAGVGCSSATDVGRNAPTQLSFTASAAAASNATAALLPITSGGHTLDLTHATLTIARAELKRTSSDACRGDDDADDDEGGDDHGGTTPELEDCAEVKVGPTMVDLPLTGQLVTVPANAIPAGTFHELELRVSSVRLQGTFDAKPFDVTLPVDARGEIEFATPLVVTDGTPTSITVNVPVSSWLVNPDGTLVDPNAILTTPALLTTVKARISASFRAFEDEDRDGRDDHDHGGDRGHDG